MKKVKTRLEKLAELPENIAKLALVNAAKEKETGSMYASYQNAEEYGFADAIGYCFLWSGTKEGGDFWAGLSDYLEEFKQKPKRIIPGPKNLKYQPFVINNTLCLGCQRFPLKSIQSFFAKWDGKPGKYGKIQVSEHLVCVADGYCMKIGEVKKIGTWIKKIS
jgi:hypothetical protein